MFQEYTFSSQMTVKIVLCKNMITYWHSTLSDVTVYSTYGTLQCPNHYVAASTHWRFFPCDLIMIQNWCHLYLIFHYPTKCMCIETLCIHVQ